MRVISMFLFVFFICCSLSAQVEFAEDIKRLNPLKINEEFSNKKYFLIAKKNISKQDKNIQIVKKISSNYFIIKFKSDQEKLLLKENLYEINDSWKLSSSISKIIDNKKGSKILLSIQASNLEDFLLELKTFGIPFKLGFAQHIFRDLFPFLLPKLLRCLRGHASDGYGEWANNNDNKERTTSGTRT